MATSLLTPTGASLVGPLYRRAVKRAMTTSKYRAGAPLHFYQKTFTLAKPITVSMKQLFSTVFLLFTALFAVAQPAPKPYGPLPIERQLKWQETEM